ncbi:transcription factor Iwr1 [Pseudohyphozyma bogoriensis]|nr:transcription factor Iwr1 [Pseudohyphozyma bogoriensis]
MASKGPLSIKIPSNDRARDGGYTRVADKDDVELTSTNTSSHPGWKISTDQGDGTWLSAGCCVGNGGQRWFRASFRLLVVLAITMIGFPAIVYHLWSVEGGFVIPGVSESGTTADSPESFVASSPPGPESLRSNDRGYVALVYSGTARSFSDNFESHIVNLMAGCPYTVHIFLHTFSNDNRWPTDLIDPDYANYRSVNATLDYFKGYTNLDGQEVLFSDAVKGNALEELLEDQLPVLYPEFDEMFEKFDDPIMYIPVKAYYYMWRSGAQAERLRQAYIKSTGIDYKWTFRMRHDATFFTNWWDKAFDISVYDPMSSPLANDVAADWGEVPTRLHDMVYRPLLSPTNTIYAPAGWGWGEINDQFAAMPSDVAFDYFTRVDHVRDMVADGFRVHAETSISWVAKHYSHRADTTHGGICYDVVRAIPDGKVESTGGPPKVECSYKKSGVEDCELECAPFLDKNRGRANAMTGTTTAGAFPSLEEYISATNSKLSSGERLATDSSSFYYFHLAAQKDRLRCLPASWTANQGNNYDGVDLPFVIKSKDIETIATYKLLTTCVIDEPGRTFKRRKNAGVPESPVATQSRVSLDSFDSANKSRQVRDRIAAFLLHPPARPPPPSTISSLSSPSTPTASPSTTRKLPSSVRAARAALAAHNLEAGGSSSGTASPVGSIGRRQGRVEDALRENRRARFRVVERQRGVVPDLGDDEGDGYGQEGVDIYDAVEEREPAPLGKIISTPADSDDVMSNFVPMLQEYLTRTAKSTKGEEGEEEDEEFVYDVYYRDLRAPVVAAVNAALGGSAEGIEDLGRIGQLAGLDEDELLDGEMSEEVEDEDDQDSNEENDYRNDYPDSEDDHLSSEEDPDADLSEESEEEGRYEDDGGWGSDD